MEINVSKDYGSNIIKFMHGEHNNTSGNVEHSDITHPLDGFLLKQQSTPVENLPDEERQIVRLFTPEADPYEQIAQILVKDLLGNDNFTIEPYPNSGPNNIHRITDAQGIQIALRMHAGIDTGIDYYGKAMVYEGLENQAGISSPHIIDIGRRTVNSLEIIFMLQEWSKGKRGLATYKQIAEIARRYHTIKTNGVGENYIMPTEKYPNGRWELEKIRSDKKRFDWGNFIDANAKRLAGTGLIQFEEEFSKMNVLDLNMTIQAAGELFNDLKLLITRTPRFAYQEPISTLVHRDLEKKNILNDEETREVIAVIDKDHLSSSICPAAEELAKHLLTLMTATNEQRITFLTEYPQGYGIQTDEEFKALLLDGYKFLLWDRLSAFRYAREVRKPEKSIISIQRDIKTLMQFLYPQHYSPERT